MVFFQRSVKLLNSFKDEGRIKCLIDMKQIIEKIYKIVEKKIFAVRVVDFWAYAMLVVDNI